MTSLSTTRYISNLGSCSYETKLKIALTTAVNTVAIGILTSIPLVIVAGVLTGTYAIYKTFQHVDLLKGLQKIAENSFDRVLSRIGCKTNTSASPRRTSLNQADDATTTLQDKLVQLQTQIDTKNRELHVLRTSLTELQLLSDTKDSTIKEQIQHIEVLLKQITDIEEELSTNGETARIRASHKALHYMIEIIENFRSNVLLGINEMTNEDKMHWEACYKIMIVSIRAFAEELEVLHLLSDNTDPSPNASPSKVLSQVLALGPLDALSERTPGHQERNPFPSLSPNPLHVSPTTAGASLNGTE